MPTKIGWCRECRCIVWTYPELEGSDRLCCDDCSKPKTLYVWDPDYEDEPEEPNERGYGVYLELVAAKFAEKNFYRKSYPMVQTIHVRTEDGNVSVFEVETEMVPSFTAHRRD